MAMREYLNVSVRLRSLQQRDHQLSECSVSWVGYQKRAPHMLMVEQDGFLAYLLCNTFRHDERAAGSLGTVKPVRQ